MQQLCWTGSRSLLDTSHQYPPPATKPGLVLMHLEAGMAAGYGTWLQAPGRSQRTRMMTTPHEGEKILHELELLSLQGDSSETQCSPALHTNPKD